MNRVNTNFEINDIYKISKDFILTKDRNVIDNFLSNNNQIKTSFTNISDHDISESEWFKSSLWKFLFLFSLEINRNISKKNMPNHNYTYLSAKVLKKVNNELRLQKSDNKWSSRNEE